MVHVNRKIAMEKITRFDRCNKKWSEKGRWERRLFEDLDGEEDGEDGKEDMELEGDGDNIEGEDNVEFKDGRDNILELRDPVVDTKELV